MLEWWNIAMVEDGGERLAMHYDHGPQATNNRPQSIVDDPLLTTDD